jgi:LmbE family N-acetylglucosaminyl deacetylase
MKKILAIGAHADDLEIGCGGLLIKAKQNGWEVKKVILTDSDFTDYYGRTIRTKNEVRDEERQANEIMGIDPEYLNFETKSLPYDRISVEAINEIIDRYKPDLILTHWPFDTHQDHRNASLATISAGRNYNNILFYEPFPPSGRSYVAFKPQVYVDITGQMETKAKAIRAHHSQVKRYGVHWIESIKGRAKMRGFECNCKYAESFEVLRLKYEL